MKYTIVFVLVASVLILACSTNEKKGNLEGKELAQVYCSGCHVVPEPSLLDKTSWKTYMLPRMGVFLGVIEHDSLINVLVEDGPGREIVEQSGIFPKKPILNESEWQAIKAYYIDEAPEALALPPETQINKGLKSFEVLIPDFKLSPPSVTYVKFNSDGTIYMGDANSQSLSVVSSKLKLIQAAKVKEGAVWTEEFDEELLVTVMGSFSPTDVNSGFILSLPKVASKMPRKIIDSLQRPVHSSYSDLDGDGDMDIVTCEFAKWTGKLSWWENNNGKFSKRILRNRPGALKAYIRDLNGDKRDDIIALFGQGDEGIYIYYNEGAGKFREETALRFPPSYGSSYFNLHDFNGDGFEDIIYTAGDNADFKPILKPYHGIYVYLNDGANRFTQQFFYHLNGAYAAVPRDFDKDGDIDIAAISFFPDYQNQPEESFVYLENDGHNKFSSFTMPDPTLGRWIVMDVSDYDKDGDDDIILGSLAFEVIPENGLVKQWINKGIPFVVLKNNSK